MGRTFLRGNVYWISYYRNGREVRESSKSNNEAKALKLLKRRLGEIQSGAFVPDEKKVTFENLVEGMKTDYELNNRRSLNTAALNNIKHLKEFFGFDRAVDITPDRVPKYQLHRRGQGASVATVNREFATLRRMFSIQIEAAARNLEWKEIDMHGRTARLKAEDSKNDEPWVLPLAGRLWEIVQARAKARRLDCPFVFHQDGQKIGDFRKAWQTACVAAGLGSFVKKEPVGGEVKKKRRRKKYTGLLVHDLRHCAVRNMSRAGVSEVVAMKITGHKTASMYRRYRIIDENEIREALNKTQEHLSATQESKVAKARA